MNVPITFLICMSGVKQHLSNVHNIEYIELKQAIT